MHVGLESCARKQTDTDPEHKNARGVPQNNHWSMDASHGPALVHPDQQQEIDGPARHYRAADLEIEVNILAEAVVENPEAADRLFGLDGLSLAEYDGFSSTEAKAIEREH